MADAVMEMEARLKDFVSKNMQALQQSLAATNAAMVSDHRKTTEAVVEGEQRMEKAEQHHHELFSLSHRELKKTLHEGMISTTLATEAAENGFLNAKGALEGFNIAMVAATSSGPAVAMMAFATVITLLANKISALNKAAHDTSWYDDIDKVSAITGAVKSYDAAISAAKATRESSIAIDAKAAGTTEEYIRQQRASADSFLSFFGLSKAATVQTKEFYEAEKILADEFGLTIEALEKAHGGHEKLIIDMQKLDSYAQAYANSQERINQLEAQKQVIAERGRLNVAQAGEDPIGRIRAEGKAREAEHANVEAIHLEKMKEFKAQEDQFEAEKAMEKEGKGKFEIEKKLRQVKEREQAEMDQYKASGEALSLQRQETALDIANKEQKIREEAARKAAEASKKAYEEQIAGNKAFWADINSLQQLDDSIAEQLQDDKFARDRERAKKQSDHELSELNSHYVESQRTEKGYLDRRTEILKAAAKNNEQIDQMEFMSRAKSVKDMATNAITAMNDFYSNSHKNALLHKTLAIAQIEVSGALAAMESFTAGGGYPYGLIPAALSELVTQAQVYKVSQAKFRDGGYTGGGGVDEPAGIVHRGEVVFSQADVARHGGASAVDSMRRTGSSGGGAGFIHTGDVQISINLGSGASEQSAKDAGRAAASSYMDRLKEFRRMEKDVVYYNVPQAN